MGLRYRLIRKEERHRAKHKDEGYYPMKDANFYWIAPILVFACMGCLFGGTHINSMVRKVKKRSRFWVLSFGCGTRNSELETRN